MVPCLEQQLALRGEVPPPLGRPREREGWHRRARQAPAVAWCLHRAGSLVADGCAVLLELLVFRFVFWWGCFAILLPYYYHGRALELY